MPPGPLLGRLLDELTERVIAEPALNDRAILLDMARSHRRWTAGCRICRPDATRYVDVRDPAAGRSSPGERRARPGRADLLAADRARPLRTRSRSPAWPGWRWSAATSGWPAPSPIAPSRSIRTTSRPARSWTRWRVAITGEAAETGLHVQAAQSLEALGRRRRAGAEGGGRAAAGKAAGAQMRRPRRKKPAAEAEAAARPAARRRPRRRRQSKPWPRTETSAPLGPHPQHGEPPGRAAPVAGPTSLAGRSRPAGPGPAAVDPFSQAETAATIEAIDAADEMAEAAGAGRPGPGALEQRAALAARRSGAGQTAASSELTRVRRRAATPSELAAARRPELATAEQESAAQAADAAPSRVPEQPRPPAPRPGSAGPERRAITARGRFPAAAAPHRRRARRRAPRRRRHRRGDVRPADPDRGRRLRSRPTVGGRCRSGGDARGHGHDGQGRG